MTTLPDYEAFARAYGAGEAEVAVTTLIADLETPVSAYLKLERGRAGLMFLLESVEGGAQRGRYSMIGLDPDLIFRSTGDRAEINRRALLDPDAFVPCPGDPLDALRSLLAESRIEACAVREIDVVSRASRAGRVDDEIDPSLCGEERRRQSDRPR